MPQLAKITIHSGERVWFFKCPYQARVIKRLEMTRRAVVFIASGYHIPEREWPKWGLHQATNSGCTTHRFHAILSLLSGRCKVDGINRAQRRRSRDLNTSAAEVMTPDALDTHRAAIQAIAKNTALAPKAAAHAIIAACSKIAVSLVQTSSTDTEDACRQLIQAAEDAAKTLALDPDGIEKFQAELLTISDAMLPKTSLPESSSGLAPDAAIAALERATRDAPRVTAIGRSALENLASEQAWTQANLAEHAAVKLGALVATIQRDPVFSKLLKALRTPELRNRLNLKEKSSFVLNSIRVSFITISFPS